MEKKRHVRIIKGKVQDLNQTIEELESDVAVLRKLRNKTME